MVQLPGGYRHGHDEAEIEEEFEVRGGAVRLLGVAGVHRAIPAGACGARIDSHLALLRRWSLPVRAATGQRAHERGGDRSTIDQSAGFIVANKQLRSDHDDSVPHRFSPSHGDPAPRQRLKTVRLDRLTAPRRVVTLRMAMSGTAP